MSLAMTHCRGCGLDITPQLEAWRKGFMSRAGQASAEALSDEERRARAAKASRANRRRPKAEKALTRAKQAEAARAMWARRKAKKESGDR